MAERIDAHKGLAKLESAKPSLATQRNRDPALNPIEEVFTNDFLTGCGLPEAWRDQAQWRILETGFSHGLNFLLTWQSWKDCANRPRMLHFVSTLADPISAQALLSNAEKLALSHPHLGPLAEQLRTQLWGLLPGLHRLMFEAGQVLLTLCVGDAKVLLRQQTLQVDSVFLNDISAAKNQPAWDLHRLKIVASCCHRGTRISACMATASMLEGLKQAGFEIEKFPLNGALKTQLPSLLQSPIQGRYNPAWEPKKSIDKQRPAALSASSCVVIGAGLAGAALAASLARRGWRVTLLEAAAAPAAGASGLPAGLLAPHVSADDSLLSRLSRSGVRITLEACSVWLEKGQDWCQSGILQRDLDGHGPKLPTAWLDHWPSAAAEWSWPSSEAQNRAAGLAPEAAGLWHASAGWIKPASLVKAWLKTPGIRWQGNARVGKIQAASPAMAGNRKVLEALAAWEVLDSDGQLLAKADLVIIAAAYESQALAKNLAHTLAHTLEKPLGNLLDKQLGNPLRLHPIRGQVSWGVHKAAATPSKAALNGHGSYTPTLTLGEGLAWLVGASYERDCNLAAVKPQDDLQNLAKLALLLPEATEVMQTDLETGQLHSWAGVRCATPSRLPLIKRLAGTDNGPQIWVCSGMGSRGLTFAGLCAELLASWLHAEPLPIERRLAQALMPNQHDAPTTRALTAALTSSPQPDAAL